VIWTENKTAVLRQLFVVKDERRKRFGIEGPNKAALKLHVKLGPECPLANPDSE
jgi:hypothetical protein